MSMLLCLSVMQSSGGVSWFLKTLLLIFFGFLSYSCLYLDMAFLMQSCVYFVVILWACMLAFLAVVAKASIHSWWLGSCIEGGGGMIAWV